MSGMRSVFESVVKSCYFEQMMIAFLATKLDLKLRLLLLCFDLLLHYSLTFTILSLA